MASGSDPYEQQLLAVFESCCEGEEGQALDGKGLARLCEKLQLEEQAPQLLERLLGRDCTSSRQITFPQFRDALLTLLAGGPKEELEESPVLLEREVRPKFVFGEKKYGRRSRPENSEPESEQEASGSDSDNASPAPRATPMSFEKKALMLDGELIPKKRKTSPERSPRNSKIESVDSGGVLGWGRGLSREEESVRATWEQLGAGHEGYLGRAELRLVCKASGLECAADELVQQLFQRLGVEPDGRISFEQFLHLFRSGLSASTNAPDDTDHQLLEEQRSLTFHTEESIKEPLFISLDTYSSGLVSAEQLLELWEAGGVAGAARLLHDLGLVSPTRRPISLAELAAALEEEARVLVEEARSDLQQPAAHTSPLTAVLHASLLIHQAEAKCLKGALEQVIGERDKLRQDLAEANERASLLAQEVDDRHARLEETAQQQARVQEQRHTEEVRGLQAQLSADREQLAALTTGLELKLGQMQGEEARLRTEVTSLAKRCERLDKENGSLREQLGESEELRTQLQWKVESLPQLELRLTELEGEQGDLHAQQVLPLRKKLEALTSENTALRDANDELTLKLEELSSRQAAKKPAAVSDDGEAGCSRGVGKRRGRPAGACSEDSSDEDSPRLGKLRRRAHAHSVAEDVSSETRLLRERVAELELQLSSCREHLQSKSRAGRGIREATLAEGREREEKEKPQTELKQVFQLMRAQILREILEEPDIEGEQQQHHPLRGEIWTLQTRCRDLTQLQQTMEAEFEMQLHHARQERHAEIQALQQRLQQDAAPQLMEIEGGQLEEMRDVQQLEQQCRDLRENLDQVKVEIVRILSDKEATSKENSALRDTISQLSSKPLLQSPPDQKADVAGLAVGEEARLRARVAELEASLELMREEYERCEDYWQGKLDDERRLFEQEQASTDERFSELEVKIHEYEELLCQEQGGVAGGRLSPIEERFPLEKQVTDLEEECEGLQLRLGRVEAEHRLCRGKHELQDAAVQTEAKHRSVSLLSGLSGSSLLSKDKQTQVDSSLEELSKNHHRPMNSARRPDLVPGDLKRFHRPPDNMLMRDLSSKPPALNGGGASRVAEQSCRVQLSVMQALSGRLQQQEQKGRRLEAVLAQHQSHGERLMQQHHDEVAALRTALQATQARLQHNLCINDEQAEKLACADMLVKELYVENALLLATVERLERRCALLAQHAPGSA